MWDRIKCILFGHKPAECVDGMMPDWAVCKRCWSVYYEM